MLGRLRVLRHQTVVLAQTVHRARSWRVLVPVLMEDLLRVIPRPLPGLWEQRPAAVVEMIRPMPFRMAATSATIAIAGNWAAADTSC